jgi:hypothetical protein
MSVSVSVIEVPIKPIRKSGLSPTVNHEEWGEEYGGKSMTFGAAFAAVRPLTWMSFSLT